MVVIICSSNLRKLGVNFVSSESAGILNTGELRYVLAYYFVRLETTKGYINKFLFNLLMTPLIKKLCYKNDDQ